MKYKILVTTRIVETIEYTEVRDAISHDLIDYCFNQEALPILVPNKIEITEHYMEDIDLLLLSGGNDVSLGSNNSSTNNEFSFLRDEVETKLIQISISKGIPILGICRGMQLINAYFGGTIKKIETFLNHSANEHEIFLENNVFPDLIFKDGVVVNSYHNYGIDKLGDQIITAAKSSDSEIEAFKHKKLPIYGVMWHPERSCSSKIAMEFNQNLFSNILEKK